MADEDRIAEKESSTNRGNIKKETGGGDSVTVGCFFVSDVFPRY